MNNIVHMSKDEFFNLMRINYIKAVKLMKSKIIEAAEA
jgi:hypothetical protein